MQVIDIEKNTGNHVFMRLSFKYCLHNTKSQEIIVKLYGKLYLVHQVQSIERYEA